MGDGSGSVRGSVGVGTHAQAAWGMVGEKGG